MQNLEEKESSLHNKSSSSQSKSEEEEDIGNVSKLLYENALDKFQKQQYKKTLIYLDTIEVEFDNFYYWRILFLRLTCYQIIIESKLKKYYNKTNITSIIKYFKLFNKEAAKFFIELRKEPENEEYLSKCECILTLILRQCYNYAQFCIHQQLLYDCIAFLSLGERLIKNTSHFFKSPDSHFYSASILLFLSSLFIISDNYGTAKRYIIICLKLSYKELELRLDINQPFSLIELNEYKENEQKKINKIFFNIAICFYHLGVCNEHEYDFESAYQSYKQAKWFGHAIPNHELVNFVIAMYNMEKRELLRLNLIQFFKNEEKNVKEEKKKPKIKSKILFDEETNIKKYERLENYLSKMNLREVDDDDPDLLNNVNGKPFSKNVGIPTKTIHVLNYLMDEKFTDVIEKMKKLDINYLSKKTKDIIQKKILNIKNEERIKNEEEKKKKEDEEKKIKIEKEKKIKTEEETKIKKKEEKKINIEEEKKIKKEEETKIKKEEDIKNDKTLREEKENIAKEKEQKNIIENKNNNKFKLKKNIKINSVNKIRLNLDNSPHYIITSQNFNSLSNDNKNGNNVFHSTFNNYKRYQIIKTSINCTKKNKTFSKEKKENEIEKIIIDNKIFNKNLKNKKRYLEEQFNRELKFQKNLLKCKGGGIGYYNSFDFDERKTKGDCEEFFKKNLENEMKLALEKNIKKEDNNKSPSYERQDVNMFRLPSKITHLMSPPKKDIIPSVENRKYIDNLTSQIEGIDIVKKYLLKSYKRNLKKNG